MEEVPIHSLYVIITETEDEWMPRILLDQPDQCINFFLTLKEDGMLAQTIFAAIGSWFVIGVSIYIILTILVSIYYVYDLYILYFIMYYYML